MDEQTQNNINVNPDDGGQKSHGALIGSIIIILILIIGGFYIFSQKASEIKDSTEETGEIQLTPSDELSDIEADLNATSDQELDAGLE